MQILNGKELSEVPHLIISFGGGSGGFSYHYRYVVVGSISAGTIRATGFAVRPALLEATSIFVLHEGVLHGFQMKSAHRKVRDEVRDKLLKDDLEGARCTMTKNCLARDIHIIERNKLVASGSWFYSGPTTEAKVEEYYKVCYEERDGIHMPVCDRNGDSTHAYADDVENAKEICEREMEDCYIVRVTEEIIDAG